jgi:hypothetical protein
LGVGVLMEELNNRDGKSRREFLAKVGKAAAVTPAVAMLLSSSVVPAEAGGHYKPHKPHKPKWPKPKWPKPKWPH